MIFLRRRVFAAPVFGWLAVMAADSLLIVLVTFFYPIRDIVLKYNPVCLLSIMGLRCGLCGGTRCLTALAHGDIVSAVRFNVFLILVICYCLLALFLAHICLVIKNHRLHEFLRKLCSVKALIIIMISWLSFMVLRNLVIIAEKLL